MQIDNMNFDFKEHKGCGGSMRRIGYRIKDGVIREIYQCQKCKQKFMRVGAYSMLRLYGKRRKYK